MEIEAKFSFRDAAAFAAWQDRAALGRFSLGPARTKNVVDRYIDTERCDCLAAGYACRVRRDGATSLATLKSLVDAEPGYDPRVRRRDELEVVLTPPKEQPRERDEHTLSLPAWQQPEAWPESEARTLALRLCHGRPLRYLVTIRQQRHERDVLDGERLVAVQSLDRVSFDAGGSPMLELEVELTDDGTTEDMARIVAALGTDSAFQPVHGSKLQRALATIAPPTARSVAAQDSVFIARLPEERDRQTARLALRLFDAIAVEQQDSARRALLLTAVQALAEGRSIRPGDPAGVARDLLDTASATHESDRALLGGTLGLLASIIGSEEKGRDTRHRHSEDPIEGAIFTGLDQQKRQHARTLAVLISVALKLDRSGGYSTQIVAVTATERALVLRLSGPNAEEDGRAAETASPAWKEVFGVKLRCAAVARGEQVRELGLRRDQPLAAAGRAILHNQFEQLESCRRAVCDGDQEALHDARVAARRMRTALRLLQSAYLERETRPLRDGLKRIGDRLGAVRDLDVLLQRVRDDRRHLPDPAALDGLLERWERSHGEAQQRLFKQLDSDAYRTWTERLGTFVEAGGTGRRGQTRVCDVLPQLIWRRYGVVHAYEPRLATAHPTELHELRKDAKQLRYLLEFFRELLGKGAPDLIAQVTAIQDALGEYHDLIVLRDLLDQHAAEHGASPGIEAYRLRIRAAIPERRRGFEALWPSIARRRFRREMARAAADT